MVQSFRSCDGGNPRQGKLQNCPMQKEDVNRINDMCRCACILAGMSVQTALPVARCQHPPLHHIYIV